VADGAGLDRSQYKIKVSLLKKAEQAQKGEEGS
jgi:hypothetical protein